MSEDHGVTTPPLTLEKVIQYHKEQCNRYTNGQCHTRACLLRGGWSVDRPDLHDAATCEYHEAVKILEDYHAKQQ